MVNTYTLHVPAGADEGDPEALEEAELVKDGFTSVPFVLGPLSFLWFFWHRLWLAGLGVLLAILALGLVLLALRVGPETAFLTELLLSLLIGLEANSLKRWTWRQRKPAVDVVAASDLDEAEAKAFSRWLGDPGAPGVSRTSNPFPPLPYRSPEPVIGLFPDMEPRR
jgi:hypothetical protein